MKNTLTELLNVYGPSGREEKTAEVIRKMVEPYVDDIYTDAMGSLIAVRKGAGKRVMLAAHMDEIGMIVTDIDENGFLRFSNIGGVSPYHSLNRRVVFENGVTGVVSRELKDTPVTALALDKMFIDIGAASAEEAEAMVSVGDVAVLVPDVEFMPNNLVSAPAIDNRGGCAVLVETLKALKTRENTVYAVFTVQEEVGLRGAKAAAYDLSPEFSVALDVTSTGDTPKAMRSNIKVGKGPCVKIMDQSVVCSPVVVKKMEEAAEKAGIQWQREVLTAGGTDAGAIQVSRGGVLAGVLSIPCRYIHSGCETASLKDMEDGVKLMTALLDSEL